VADAGVRGAGVGQLAHPQVDVYAAGVEHAGGSALR
jgi:hypothetical protein